MYEKHTIIRRFRRSDEPTMGFFPWGLIGLLLILLPLILGLFPFAKNSIQARVKAETQEELTLNSLHWVQVDVDGQGVRLSGEGTKAEGDKALSIAKGVKGDTWLGALVAPISVRGDFSEPKPVVKTPPPKPKKAAPVALPSPEWGQFTSTLQSSTLTLSGVVGSQIEKSELLTLARSRINAPRLTEVIDKIGISQKPLIQGSQLLAKRTVTSMALCNTGQSRSAGGVYTIDCQANIGDAKRALSIASNPLSKGRLGKIRVSTTAYCNQLFASALDGKSIGFSVGSSALKAESSTLIDEIAEITKACPGTIRVEGHTDDTGDFDKNMRLSHARAESLLSALVERGVKRERLQSQGFGPKNPRAEGTSREARALNRRIEFKISE